MNDVDYGQHQREARLHNRALLYDWTASKPRLRWQAWLLVALLVAVCAAVCAAVVYVARGA